MRRYGRCQWWRQGKFYCKTGNRKDYFERVFLKTHRSMGTTVVLAVLLSDKAYVAYVGDSRLYHYKDKKLKQITKDHSRVQELMDRGIITKDEARNHPEKNMITRAVGIMPDVNVDFMTLTLEKNDKLLLCSDGLSNICTDEEMEFVLREKEAEQAVRTLIDLANMGGGNDNITVVVVDN